MAARFGLYPNDRQNSTMAADAAARQSMQPQIISGPRLIYTLMCDDVRIEMGNKISLMGIFQNIMVEQMPVSLIKFAVINHWVGTGNYTTEVRILHPDKLNLVVTSQPTSLELSPGGFTDNVSFFVNVIFPNAGTYWVQTLADEKVIEEFPLIVADSANVETMMQPDNISDTIN